MSKLIDSEKLLSEIEYRKGVNIRITCEANKNYCRGYADAIKDILHAIFTLQQKQPDVDLEKEISDTCRSYRIRGDFDGAELNKHDIENIASHFYELGLNTRKEE